MPPKPISGQCLCGAVRFVLDPPLRDVIVCHCRQCARWTGSTVAATAVAAGHLRFENGEGDLRWYAATPQAERGFCGHCGSSLFWKPKDGSRVSVMAGALDPPTGLSTRAHVFIDDKSDYYEICDGAAQYDSSGGAVAQVPP